MVLALWDFWFQGKCYVFDKLACIFSNLISHKKNWLDEFLGITTLRYGISKLWHTNQVHMGGSHKKGVSFTVFNHQDEQHFQAAATFF